MKIVGFVFVALVALPAAYFLAGVYAELLGRNVSAVGVMWGFLWMALWYAMRPLS